jgi:lipid-binding SYLF domain-containing protein
VKTILGLLATAAFILSGNVASADEFDATIERFKNAGQSAEFFDKSYGYAVFPTIGKAAFGVGAGRGRGRVFAQGVHVGDSTVTKLSIGFQAGGQAYSQIIFFEDKRAFDEFTSSNFEFAAGVSAVVITASAGAEAGSTGKSAGAASGRNDAAATAGRFVRGMAVFTIVKGGAMYEASVAGQRFSYTPLAKT